MARLGALASAVPVLAASGAGAAEVTGPMLGVNVTTYTAGEPPNCYGTSILYDYGQPRVRSLVRDQLAAMRAGGVEAIRFFLTYDRDTSENRFFVPARTGRLEQPWRASLIAYLRDVREAGFRRLTLTFDPRHSAEPAQDWPHNGYAPATFSESWSLISDIRPLLKRYGPRETRVDLLNEGAPGDYLTEQVSDWISRMYANYVEAFGSDDVTVSTGFWAGMSRLISALRASGKPLPRWFDLHPRWTAGGARADLRAVDAELNALGLSQPLVVGEEKYNDPAVADAIAEFIRTSSRRVDEVSEWPLERGGGEPSNQQTRCISPPYRIDSYASALRGRTPSTTLLATISDASLRFRTPYGYPVTALIAGRYTVRITDASQTRGFFLDNRRTSPGFRGRTTWLVTLGARTHTYGAVGARPRRAEFRVMNAG